LGVRNILDSLLFRRKSTPPAGTLGDARIRYRSPAGIIVNEETGLKYSAVWACTRLISQTVAGLPFHLFQRVGDSRKRIQASIDSLIGYNPNEELDKFNFWQTLVAWALTWGNGCAEIVRENGRPVAMYLLEPDRISAGRDENGRLYYEYQSGMNTRTILAATDVFHLRGLSWSGYWGYSVIGMAARCIGLGLAAEEFGSRFFGSGAHPSGVLEHPGPGGLSDQAISRLKKAFSDEHVGIDRSHRVLIAEEGLKWKPMSIPPEDAQFLQTREFQVPEICRWFGVQPHKIAHLVDATYSNIDAQNVEFGTDTIAPWTGRIEAEADLKLLSVRERNAGYFTRLNLAGIMRGDLSKRYEAYRTARTGGWMSANDILRKEDENPIGPEGDEIFIQGAMVPLKQAAQGGTVPESPTGQEPPNQPNAREAMRSVMELGFERIAMKEAHRVEQYVKKYADRPEDFAEKVAKFYLAHREHMRITVDRTLRSALHVAGLDEELADNGLQPYVAGWIDDRVTRSRGELENGAFEAVIGGWMSGRAARDASDFLDGLTDELLKAEYNGRN